MPRLLRGTLLQGQLQCHPTASHTDVWRLLWSHRVGELICVPRPSACIADGNVDTPGPSILRQRDGVGHRLKHKLQQDPIPTAPNLRLSNVRGAFYLPTTSSYQHRLHTANTSYPRHPAVSCLFRLLLDSSVPLTPFHGLTMVAPTPEFNPIIIVHIAVGPRSPSHGPGSHCARHGTNSQHKEAMEEVAAQSRSHYLQRWREVGWGQAVKAGIHSFQGQAGPL